MSKTVLILGAKSDIGKAIAHIFSKEGFTLQLAGRNLPEIEAISSDLQIRYSVKTSVHEFDALNFDTHESFYKSLSPSPDVVICVFGYLGTQESASKNSSEALKIVQTNYTGAISILDIAANALEAKGSGDIIGISSVAGDRGRASNYHYGSAKAGFSEYLSGLRNRLAKKGVHVMTVKPGFVATRMTEGLDTPAPLTASPEQVAKDIWKAYKSKKNILYTLWIWKYIMLIIRNIPEFIFKKLSL